MSILTFFFLLVVTCVVFWLFTIAYKHAGAIPAPAPPFLPWALQGLTIVVLIAVICTLWGVGLGYGSDGSLCLPK